MQNSLRPWLLPEPEDLLWYGLAALSCLLAALKLLGLLLLSWWWVVLPVSLPFLALAILFAVIALLKAVEVLWR